MHFLHVGLGAIFSVLRAMSTCSTGIKHSLIDLLACSADCYAALQILVASSKVRSSFLADAHVAYHSRSHRQCDLAPKNLFALQNCTSTSRVSALPKIVLMTGPLSDGSGETCDVQRLRWLMVHSILELLHHRGVGFPFVARQREGVEDAKNFTSRHTT